MEIDVFSEEEGTKATESNSDPADSLGGNVAFLKSTQNFTRNLNANILVNPFRVLKKKAQKRKLFKSEKKKKKARRFEQIETIDLSSSDDDERDEVIFVPLPDKQQQIINLDSDEEDKDHNNKPPEDSIDNKQENNIFLKPLSPTNSIDKRLENSSCCTSPSSIISYDDFIMHNDRQRVKKNVQSDEGFFPGIDDSLAEAPVQIQTEATDDQLNEDSPSKEVEKNAEAEKPNNNLVEIANETLNKISNNSNIDLIEHATITRNSLNIYDSDSSMSEINKLQIASESKVKKLPKSWENPKNLDKNESSLSMVLNPLSNFEEIVENPCALYTRRKQKSESNSEKKPTRKDDNCFFAQLRLLAEGNDDRGDVNSNNKEVDSVFNKVNTIKNYNECKTNNSTELFPNEGSNDAGIFDNMNNLEDQNGITSDKPTLITDQEENSKEEDPHIDENRCLQNDNEGKEETENIISDEEFCMPSPPLPPTFPKGFLTRNFASISSIDEPEFKKCSEDPITNENLEKSLGVSEKSKDESNLIVLENDDEENSISKLISNETNTNNKNDESFVVIEDDEDDNLPSTSASLRAKIMRNQAKNSTALLKLNDKKSSNDENQTTSLPTKSNLKKDETYVQLYNKDLLSQNGIGWSEEQIRFYDRSWNGEKFDVDKLLDKMNNDRKNWKIIPTDQSRSSCRKENKLKCFNCYNIGHRKVDCPYPLKTKRCRICGDEGHLEPECPNKCCLRCGMKTNGFYRNCNNCAFQNRERCNICKYMGHNANNCPDRWRRYHSTTKNVEKLKQNYQLKSRAYCSYCGKAGHFAEACRKEKNPRDYPTVTFRICSYERIYGPTPNAVKQKGLFCHLLYTPYDISVKNKSLFAPVKKSPLYSRILIEIGLSHLLKQKRLLDQASIKSQSTNKRNKYEDTEHQQRPKPKPNNTPKKQDSTTMSKSNSNIIAAEFDENYKVSTTSDNSTTTEQNSSFRLYVSPFGTMPINIQISPNPFKTDREILPLNEQNNRVQPQPAKIQTVVSQNVSVTQPLIKVKSLKSLCIEDPQTINAGKSLMPLSIPNSNATLPLRGTENSTNDYDSKDATKESSSGFLNDAVELQSRSVLEICPIAVATMDSDSNYSFSDHFDENIKAEDTKSTVNDKFNRPPIGPTPDYIPIFSSNNLDDDNEFVEPPRSPSISPTPSMEKAKILLIPNHEKFLNTRNGQEMLKSIIGNMMIEAKLSQSTAGPILELQGPSDNLETFQNRLMEALKREYDDHIKNRNANDLASRQLPRRVEPLIRQLRLDLATLRSKLGYAYEFYKRLMDCEKQMNHSKNAIKTMNKLKRNLNMILIGQAGLENGKSHILMIFDILKDLVDNYNMDDKVPAYLRNKLCLYWQKIFAPHRYPNYAELLEQYKKLDIKNQYLELQLDPLILGDRVLNTSLDADQMEKMNSIHTPQNNNIQLNEQKQEQGSKTSSSSSLTVNRFDMISSSLSKTPSSVINNQNVFNPNDLNHSNYINCDRLTAPSEPTGSKLIQLNVFCDPNANINNNKKIRSANESPAFMNPEQRSNTPTNLYVASKNWEHACQAVFNEIEKGAGTQATKRTNKLPSVHWSRESVSYLEKLIDMVGFNPTLSNTIRRFLKKAYDNQLNVDEHKAIKNIFISAQSRL